MKLSGSRKSLQSIDALGEEGVTLLPTEAEDMWHAHNLIAPGDELRGHAIRRVDVLNPNSTSDSPRPASKRVHTELRIRVEKTFFDAAASRLHISGPNIEENEYVAVGQYHTLDLEVNRPFTIWKKHGWDSVAREELRNALQADNANEAVAAVVMQEGRANICLIAEFQTELKQSVDGARPNKMGGAKQATSATQSFFDKVLSTLLRAIDFQSPRPLLLASPGFVAQDFKKYIADVGANKGDKMLQRLAKDAVVVHSSSGHVHALNEVLRSSEVQATMKDKKFSSETKAIDDFFDKLKLDDGRAWYGVKPVAVAVREGAVGRGGGVLLVNNSLFRSLDIETRKAYVSLVDKVRADGGMARILSADHESGRRLAALGGIATVLTYPMPELDEESDEEEGEGGPTVNAVQGGANNTNGQLTEVDMEAWLL